MVKEVSSEIDDANPELSVAKAVIVLQKLLALHRHNLRIIEEQRDRYVIGVVLQNNDCYSTVWHEGKVIYYSSEKHKQD